MPTTLTDRLGGLIRRIRGSRPVQVHIRRRGGEAAESLEQLADEDQPAANDGGGASRWLPRMPGAKRDEAINQLREGFDEVVDLVRTVRRHLDDQAERSERLLHKLDGLPEAMQSLQETNRNQTRIAESVEQHMERQQKDSQQLNQALGNLAQSTEHQGQVLGVLQEQIHASRQTDEQMLHSFSNVNQTLQQLSQTTQQSSRTLEQVSEQRSTSEQQMQELIRRTNKHMTIMTAANWALAVAALGVATYAALAASGLVPGIS